MYLCKMQKIAHYILALLVPVLASCGHTAGWAELDRADAVIMEHPDSALAIIEAVDSSTLRGREERARYALLHSMALDKNAIFRKDFDILQPAIDYYSSHGTPDERLRMHHYRGRIYQIRGEAHLAMTYFMRGEELRGQITDTLTFANMLVCHGMMLHLHTMFDEMNKLFKEALPLYEAIGRESHRLDCLAKLLNGAVMVEDKALADSVMSVLEKSDASEELKNQMIYPDMISYAVFMADRDSVPSIRRKLPPDSLLDGYTGPPMALLYARIGQAERGRRLLESSEILDSAKYYSIALVVYDSLHDYRRAYEAHAAFTLLESDEHISNLENTYAFSNMEYEKMHEKEKELHSRNVTIILTVSGIIILGLITILLTIRSRAYRLQQQNMQLEIDKQKLVTNEINLKLAREQAERQNQQLELEKRNLENDKQRLEINALRSRLKDVEDDRDSIQEMLDIRTEARSFLNEDSLYQLLRNHVDKLNDLLKIGLEGVNPDGSRFREWYLRYVEDKKEFLSSLIKTYRVIYPGFIEYLECSGLDSKEIVFTCLAGMGLRNKEIGNYLSTVRHNQISVVIRNKLKIKSSRINVGIQELLRKFDLQNQSKDGKDRSRSHGEDSE